MLYIARISTGTASAIVGWRMLKRYGANRTLLNFQDTNWEDEDNYRFLKDLMAFYKSEFGNVRLITQKDGRTPLQVAEDRMIIPSDRMAPCTMELKIKQFEGWLWRLPRPITIGLGLGPLEPHRIERIIHYHKIDGNKWRKPQGFGQRIPGVYEEFPLTWNIPEFGMRPIYGGHQDIVRSWGLTPPRMYEHGFPHANCFAGDERFVTANGVRTFRETVGQTVTLMTKNGKWVEAPIKEFGQQPIVALHIRRNSERKTIYTTSNHRWLTYVGNRGNNRTERLTHELRPGTRIITLFGRGLDNVRPSPFGIAHGIVFGDGTKPNWKSHNAPAMVTLCGEKEQQLIRYFPNSHTRWENGKGMTVTDLPRYFKERPPMDETRSYLYGWLAGYFATDGTVSEDGSAILSSSNKDNLEFVRDVCYKLGVGTFGVRMEMRNGYGDEPTPLYNVRFIRQTLDPEFFLIAKHRQRAEMHGFEYKQAVDTWIVEGVNDTDRIETVYCAVVPETHCFMLEDNILTGNCGARCVRQGIREWKRLWMVWPERFAEVRDWELAQQAKGGARAKKTILTDRTGGKRVPITLAELERRWTSSGQLSATYEACPDDQEACFCTDI